MRIAFLPDGTTANTLYRSIGPIGALAARGHDVRELKLERIADWHDAVRWCELLHVHRVCDGGVVELARAAKAAGAAVVWDDDDDVTRVPRGTAGYAQAGGSRGRRRLAARARLFETVDLVTTPSAALAETFLEGGAPAARVVENYVLDPFRGSGPSRGGGVTIGWFAGNEPRFDLREIPLEQALRRVLDAHPHVRVETIGVRLALEHDRYAHTPPIALGQLTARIGGFDLGLAPLSPAVPLNHARSNIKLKEYAASGVPWLASPIGPYAGLGEKQGGRLVDDDRWFEELDALVGGDRTRRKLAKRAKRWGEAQRLDRNAGEWEEAFAEAIERARRLRAAA